MTEGFKNLADTVEAVREMREAQDGVAGPSNRGLQTVAAKKAAAEEEEEWEDALEVWAGPSNRADPGGEAGTSASFFAGLAQARLEEEQARKAAAEEAAEEEDVEVEVLSQQLSALSPSKSPPTKKPKKGGGSASDPIKLTESEE